MRPGTFSGARDFYPAKHMNHEHLAGYMDAIASAVSNARLAANDIDELAAEGMLLRAFNRGLTMARDGRRKRTRRTTASTEVNGNGRDEAVF